MLFAHATGTIGKKVRLTEAFPEDAGEILDAWQPCGIRDAFHRDKPRSEEEEIRYLARNADSSQDHLFLVRRLEPDNRIVGTCGLHDLNDHALTARLGFCLFCDDEGVGECLEEAVQLTIKLAFDQLKLRCVWAHVPGGDKRAFDFFVRLGFIDATRDDPSRDVRIFEYQNPSL